MNLNLETLQLIWLGLVVLLFTVYLILDGFDLGAGIWHLFLHPAQRRKVIVAVGPFWDGNEVWLLTGGGALFAAFPYVYATVFSAFYLALFLVLAGLIFRAVGIEYRNKLEEQRWIRFWDRSFAIGSLIPALLFGVALANVVRGLELDQLGNYQGTFFDLLNPFALLGGLLMVLLLAIQGGNFLLIKLSEEVLHFYQVRRKLLLTLCLVLTNILALWAIQSYARQLHVWALALLGLLDLVIIVSIVIDWMSVRNGLQFVLSTLQIALWGLLTALILFPNLVPATNNPNWSITYINGSSSLVTLKVMLVIVLIGMPIVASYTAYIYRVFKEKIA